MFKSLLRAGLVTIAVSVAAPAVAVPITGELFMAGRFGTNTGDLGTATALTFSGAYVVAGSGAYDAIPDLTSVIYHGFTFNPSPASPINPLWNVTAGGHAFSFVMTDVAVRGQTSGQLSLYGTGTLYGTGYDPTPGIWEFSGWVNQSGRLKFTTESANVPEPGTLALLGLGLGIMGLGIRRRSANV